MTQAFWKNIYRTIKKSFGRYMAIFAIIALGVGFFAGLKMSKPDMMQTARTYLTETKFSDFRLLSTWGFSSDEVEALQDLPEAASAEGAISCDFLYVNENGEEDVLKAHSITTQSNLLVLSTGRLPENDTECVLDMAFFDEDMIGSSIQIAADNTDDTKQMFAHGSYTVTGLVRSPLYLNRERGVTTLGSGKVKAFVFLPLDSFSSDYFTEVDLLASGEQFSAFTRDYDEKVTVIEDSLKKDLEEIVHVRYQKEVDRANDLMVAEQQAAAQQALAAISPPTTYVLGRDKNVGYASYENDVDIVDSIAKVFPVFFFLIAALVCSTTMTRMVDDEHTQIGTLRAMGYSKNAIFAKYIIYSASAAGLGAVSGFFLGIRIFPKTIWTAYGSLYGFTDLLLVTDYLLLFLSLLAAFLCSAGMAYFACRMELSHSPAHLIRPKSPPAGKRIFLERLPFLWSRMKFIHKVSARNIFRFKKRMFMMIVGIAGCMALVLTGMGIRDSVSDVVNTQYSKIFQYDIAAAFSDTVTTDLLSEIDREFSSEIKNRSVLMETGGELSVNEGGNKSVTLLIDRDEEISHCVDLHYKGQTITPPDFGEVVLDSRLAATGNFKIGDSIVLNIGETESKPLIVSGFFENYIYYYAYMTDKTYEDAFDKTYEPNSIFLSLSPKSDAYRIAKYLGNLKNAASITVVSDLENRVNDMMSSLNYVVLLVIASAGALAFIVLFNLGNINITERVREIATLKVLGFYSRETAAYVFRENMTLSLIGMALGVPLGIVFHRFVISQIRIAMMSFETKINPLSFLLSLVIVFAFTLVVDLILRRKIEKIDMADSLKSME